MTIIHELLPLYKIMLYFWIVGFSLWLVYLYGKYRESHDVIIPQNVLPTTHINPVELSYLMERKITPRTMVASILALLEVGAIQLRIQKGQYTLFYNQNYDKKLLPDSQSYLLHFLFEDLVGCDRITLEQLEMSTMSHKDNSIFLLDYQIWKKIALKEAVSKQYYEMKKEYPAILFYRNLGFVLAGVNFILQYHFWFGYFLIVPALFLSVIFKLFHKRRPEAEALYYEMLAFAAFLDSNMPLTKREKAMTYFKYSVVLGRISQMEEKLKAKSHFASQLNTIMEHLVTKAVWFGDRSIFS